MEMNFGGVLFIIMMGSHNPYKMPNLNVLLDLCIVFCDRRFDMETLSAILTVSDW